MRDASVIEVVDRAYDLVSDEAAWVMGLQRAITHALRGHHGAFTHAFQLGSGGVVRGASYADTDVDAATLLGAMYANMTPEVERTLFRSSVACGSLADAVASAGGPPEMVKVGARLFRDAAGVSDLYVLTAHGARGWRMYFSLPQDELLGPTDARERARWSRVAEHVSAAYRLRQLGGEDQAVLDPSGRALHAVGEARAPRARALLREAVRGRETARRSRDSDRALAVWRGVIDGRWSLVDRFDADGRRFLVARACGPEPGDPRALDAQERAAAQLLARGLSTKVIAAELGVSIARVGALVAALVKKTRSRKRADLLRLLRQLPVET